MEAPPNFISLEEARGLIYSVDLSLTIDRLVHIEKWNRSEAAEVSKQYRNYLFLRKKYPERNLPPSKEVDEVWHAHVLHTQDYREFCKKAFANEEGQYLDHHPHVVKAGSVERLERLFEQTQALYYKEFGEYLYQIIGKSFIIKLIDKWRDTILAKFPKLASAINAKN